MTSGRRRSTASRSARGGVAPADPIAPARMYIPYGSPIIIDMAPPPTEFSFRPSPECKRCFGYPFFKICFTCHGQGCNDWCPRCDIFSNPNSVWRGVL